VDVPESERCDIVRCPDACSLPAAERPLRLAEFDDLFATEVLLAATRVSSVRHAGSVLYINFAQMVLFSP
jgi:hypothetical protein